MERKRLPATKINELNKYDMTDPVTIDDSVRSAIGRIRDDPSDRVQALVGRLPDTGTVDRQTECFSALANEDRVRILSILREGECCVCELQAALDAPQSTIASHLRQLRDAGMINARKDGKWTYYRIADTATLQLLDLAAALGGNSE